MTANEYREAIAELGLSQVAAARFLEVDARTSRRYALGEARVPGAADKLLRLMVVRKLSVETVCKILGETWGDE